MSTLTKVVGQRVLLDPPGPDFYGAAHITKVNPVNIKVTMEDGRRVNVAPAFLSDLPEGEPVPPRPNYREQARVIVAPERCAHQPCGALVTVDGKPGQVFVVLADKIEKINVAVLGGDSDRYWRMPAHLVHPLTVKEARNRLTYLDA